MTKKYSGSAFWYAVLALAGGVFYREFTKMNGFMGITQLAFVHVHWLVLGTGFFLLLTVISKNVAFENEKTSRFVLLYQIGLNDTVACFFARGILQVLGMDLSRSWNAAVSGIAGVGHILLAAGLLLLLDQIRKAA